MSVAKLIGPDIEELIRENPQELAAALANLHPVDIAELMEGLPRGGRVLLFASLPPDGGAAVLAELKGETLRLILHEASPDKLGPELDLLPADEVTFLLEHLTQRQRETLLARMSPRDAAMAENVPRIRAEWTAAETLEHLKKIDPEVETVQSLYIVDDHDHLIGSVSLRKLLPAPPTRLISDLLEKALLTV